jgi:hypothetical protein
LAAIKRILISRANKLWQLNSLRSDRVLIQTISGKEIQAESKIDLNELSAIIYNLFIETNEDKCLSRRLIKD